MSRHRSVRGYNYDDDFEEDDIYGQSMEDDYGVSPATAAQFMYQRSDFQLANFVDEPLKEEDEECEEQLPANSNTLGLSDINQARLHSCLEEMRNITGDAFPEPVMVQAVLNSNFEMEKALNLLFLQTEKTHTDVKEQRPPRSSKGKLDKLQGLSCRDSSHNPLSCSEDLDLRHLLETYDPGIQASEQPEELKHVSNDSNQISSLSLSSLLNDEEFSQNATSFQNNVIEKCSEKKINSSSKSLPSHVPNVSLAEIAMSSLASEKDVSSLPSTLGSLSLSVIASSAHSHSLTQPMAIQTIRSGQKCEKVTLLSQSLESNSSDVMSIGLEKLMQPFDGLGSSESSLTSSPCLGGVNLGSCIPETPSLAFLINKQEQRSPSNIQSSASSPSNASGTGNNSLSIESFSLAELAKRHSVSVTRYPSSSPRCQDLAPSLSNVRCAFHPNESISAAALKSTAIKAVHNSDDQSRENGNGRNVQPFSDKKENVLCNAVATTLTLTLHEAKNAKQQTVGGSFQQRARTNRTQLFKKPSSLAMALCFQPPNRLLRDRSKIRFRVFEYNRQVMHVHVKREDPLGEIKFFDFAVPSPDDVVKCLQKNAFTRGEVV